MNMYTTANKELTPLLNNEKDLKLTVKSENWALFLYKALLETNEDSFQPLSRSCILRRFLRSGKQLVSLHMFYLIFISS